MSPAPIRVLVWLLRKASTRDAASAVVGDVIEELGERRGAGRAPSFPALWVNVKILQALAASASQPMPRLGRAAGLILRDAVRALLAAPAHSSFIVVVLAAGITLATVTFSIVDAVVLKPLPLDDPEQVVGISTRDEHRKRRITSDVFWRLHDELTSVETMAARMTTSGNMVTVGGITDQWSVMRATADIFPLLRAQPAIGRLWTSNDEAQSNTDIAVLSHVFWRERFGADPSILGKTVVDGRRTYTIIGVLSAENDHPELDLFATPVWVPMSLPRTPSQTLFGITARMRPGVTPAQVAEDVRRVIGAPDWRPDVTRMHDGYVSSVRNWMFLALGAAALVVLVACANAANLMLARSAARAQEMAVRASLGASRRQIAGSVLAEGLLLSAAATAAALLLSIGGIRLASVTVATALPGLFRVQTIALNGRVLAAAIACALATGALCALVPAWQTSRVDVSTLLKDTEAPTATGRRRWSSMLLRTEIATVTVLLVVAWLFVVSLIRVARVDLGIDTTNLLAVTPRIEFRASVDDVERRIRQLPGVSDVAISIATSLPLVGRAFHGAWHTTSLQAVGEAAGSDGSPIEVLDYRVTSNYFAVAGIGFLRGGTWQDDSGSALVVVLADPAARQLFGGQDPIGRQVKCTRPAGVFTVIGTVPHVYSRGPEESNPPSAYFPLKPDPARVFAGLFVRTSRPSDEMIPKIAKALEPVGPQLNERFVFGADDAVRRITSTRRFHAQLMSVFGLMGMLIGAAGVYAGMAWFVAQQTREIGVRTALGATPSRIQSGVLRLAWRHLLAGFAIGLPAAWWMSRGLDALLFQVTPGDLSVYVGVAAMLAAVGLLAAWIPARRASRIDPLICLRR